MKVVPTDQVQIIASLSGDFLVQLDPGVVAHYVGIYPFVFIGRFFAVVYVHRLMRVCGTIISCQFMIVISRPFTSASLPSLSVTQA